MKKLSLLYLVTISLSLLSSCGESKGDVNYHRYEASEENNETMPYEFYRGFKNSYDNATNLAKMSITSDHSFYNYYNTDVFNEEKIEDNDKYSLLNLKQLDALVTLGYSPIDTTTYAFNVETGLNFMIPKSFQISNFIPIHDVYEGITKFSEFLKFASSNDSTSVNKKYSNNSTYKIYEHKIKISIDRHHVTLYFSDNYYISDIHLDWYKEYLVLNGDVLTQYDLSFSYYKIEDVTIHEDGSLSREAFFALLIPRLYTTHEYTKKHTHIEGFTYALTTTTIEVEHGTIEMGSYVYGVSVSMDEYLTKLPIDPRFPPSAGEEIGYYQDPIYTISLEEESENIIKQCKRLFNLLDQYSHEAELFTREIIDDYRLDFHSGFTATDFYIKDNLLHIKYFNSLRQQYYDVGFDEKCFIKESSYTQIGRIDDTITPVVDLKATFEYL